jgi:hypothetical protein
MRQYISYHIVRNEEILIEFRVPIELVRLIKMLIGTKADWAEGQNKKAA